MANLNTDAVAELEAKLIGDDSPEKQEKQAIST